MKKNKLKENGSLCIGENKISRGTKTTILFAAPNINTQVKMDIPVHVFHGKNPGPKIFIVSAIHGDELNSIEIIRRVHHHLKPAKLNGTVITVPVTNIYGLIMQSRYLPDRRDLNRTFPGSKTGSLAARLANGVIEQVVKHCDYGIDLHTGSSGKVNIPQLRVNLETPGVKRLAIAFDAPVILDVKLRDGSLRQTASELGIPLLVYEGGEAMRFNELCIRAGVRGVLNVLSFLGMIKQKKVSGKKPKPLITRTSSWVRASVSGMIETMGDVIAKPVKKNQILGYIHDPFIMNESVPVKSPFNGIVIGQALKPTVSVGDALFHIASLKKMGKIQETIEEFQDEIVSQDDE